MTEERPIAAHAIELRDVVKVYGSGPAAVQALDGVSLTVAPGEFVAVSGPSASGKSTLLHLAGGLDGPTSGTVAVRGEDLARLRPAELARVRRRQVGYVFQRYNLVPSLTAVENVMLPLEFGGMPARQARGAAAAAIERVGISPPFDRFPDDLSGGERQRVAIARAIAGERDAILADEPTGALDTITGDLVVELLAELAASGTSVVLVTHEPRFASWADRVVFMRDGRIVDESSPAPPTPPAGPEIEAVPS
ncbi:MAG: ABC transporter ATP-binding protein [Acidimicrobiales bacterium]